MAAVGEDGELDSFGPPVFEERIDRRPNGASRVEHIVDEDHRQAFELEVELRVAHERLRPARSLAGAHVDVVAMEGDVELAEVELAARALGDQAAQALGERNAARVDADERDGLDVLVPLDHLVGDARKRPLDALGVEQDASGRHGMLLHRTPFRPRWTDLKACAPEHCSRTGSDGVEPCPRLG